PSVSEEPMGSAAVLAAAPVLGVGLGRRLAGAGRRSLLRVTVLGGVGRGGHLRVAGGLGLGGVAGFGLRILGRRLDGCGHVFQNRRRVGLGGVVGRGALGLEALDELGVAVPVAGGGEASLGGPRLLVGVGVARAAALVDGGADRIEVGLGELGVRRDAGAA